MIVGLRRFRLDGIGPAGARFDPLEVELTDAGRAASSAVLFLENGGGKSVLLRLLFSVVLPGRRRTLGSARLEDYVLAGDTGQVALEWQLPDGGRLVTGTVLEWRNRTRSANAANLLQVWYSFRPVEGVLELGLLPFREGDRRVTRSGFKDRLSALAGAHPELQLVAEDRAGAWSEHLLGATPLDPALFDYQRQMNADEAEADNLFSTVRDDESFVAFLVDAVASSEELDAFGDLVSELRIQLARRQDLETERDFCLAASASLRPLGSAFATRGAERRSLESAIRRAGSLAARLRSGEAAASAEADAASQVVTFAAREAIQLGQQADQQSAVAAELRRVEAELLLAVAEEAHAVRSSERDRLAREVEAWAAVESLFRLDTARADLAALRAAALQVHDALEQPLREAELAGSHLAWRLHEEKAELVELAHAARRRASSFEEQRAEATERHARLERARGEAIEAARSLRQRVASVAEKLEEARSSGLVAEGESAVEAASRRKQSATASAGRLVALAAFEADIRRRASQSSAQRTMHAGELAELGADLRLWTDELERAQERARRLLEDEGVAELAATPADLWAVGTELGSRLRAAIEQLVADARHLGADIGRLEDSLAALERDGLWPAHPDLRRTWDAVVRAGIPASAGWSWLATNLDAEGQRRVLEANPALAGGVIVTDPSRVADALVAIASAGVELDSVVSVGSAEDLEGGRAIRAAPVRRALYDREEASREAVAGRGRLEAMREALVEVNHGLLAREPVAGELAALLRECPPARRAWLRTEVERLRAAVDELRAAIARLDASIRDDEASLESLLSTRPALEEARVADERAAARLEQLAEAEVEANELGIEARSSEERERELARLAEDARAKADEAGASRGELEIEARDAEAGAELLAVEASALVPPPAVVPEAIAGLSTGELRARAAARRKAYEAARDHLDLSGALRQAEADERALSDALAEHDAELLDRARALGQEPGAGDRRQRERRRRDVSRQLERAGKALDEASAARGAARRTLEDRTPAGRARHFVLEQVPTDARTAARLAGEAQARVSELGARARAAQQRSEEGKRIADEARHRGEVLASIGQGLSLDLAPAKTAQSDLEPLAEPYAGTPDEARAEAAEALDTLLRARERVFVAERALERAEGAVRQVAGSPRFSVIGGVRVALLAEDVESLGARAERLAAEVQAMASSVESELSELARHREGVVLRLSQLVEAHLAMLARLARVSRLPDGLGEWSGQPFLSIRFERPDPGQVPGRLGEVVDAALAGKPVPPLELLLSAMRAAVGHRRLDAESGGERRLPAGGSLSGDFPGPSSTGGAPARPFEVQLLRPNAGMRLQWAGVGAPGPSLPTRKKGI